MPAVERYNLASRVDRWVIGAALRGWAGNSGALTDADRFFINLSGDSLGDRELVDFIRQGIEGCGVSRTGRFSRLLKPWRSTISRVPIRSSMSCTGSGGFRSGRFRQRCVVVRVSQGSECRLLKITACSSRISRTDLVDMKMVRAITVRPGDGQAHSS